jgi:hypothetical protein
MNQRAFGEALLRGSTFDPMTEPSFGTAIQKFALHEKASLHAVSATL